MPKFPSFIPRCYRYLTLAGLMSLAMATHAKLPEPIQQALARAQLNENDLSLVIVPLGKNASHSANTTNNNERRKSRLPAAIKPEADEDLTATSSDATGNSETPKSHGKKHPQQTLYLNDGDIVARIHHDQGLPESASTDSVTVDDLTQSNVTDHAQQLRQTKPVPPPLPETPSGPLPEPLLGTIAHLASVNRTPASTMKLIPTFIALDMLGSDFAWYTRVYYSGIRLDKHLYGDLIIQGSGDPKLTDERLQQLLYQVKQAGIHHIHGNIILDSSVFKNVSKDPAAFDHDPLRPYNASPDGLLVNFSSIKIQSYPTSDSLAEMIYTPRLADYKLPESIAMRSGYCANAHYSISPSWQKSQLSFDTALPSHCGEHTFYIAYPDAKEFATKVVKQLWSQLGNTLSGQVINQEQPVTHYPLSPLPVVSYPSLPLSTIIHDINHHSNNVMTEQVTLSLPVYAATANTPLPTVTRATTDKIGQIESGTTTGTTQGEGQINTTTQPPAIFSLYHQGRHSDYPKALHTVEQWWQSHLTSPSPHLTNGSGLCRTCSVTATNLAELLSYAYDHPEFSTYVDSLGIAGVSGTIGDHKKRLPSSKAIGRAWIKTGTLNNVTAMAGYVKGLSEQDYVVVGIINSDNALDTHAARKVLDEMLDWTAQH